MADIIAASIAVTALTGGAARVQILGGKQFSQWTIYDFELTAAQNTSLQAGLAAGAGTITTIHQTQATPALLGISNEI